MDLATLIRTGAQRHPDSLAVVCDDTELTYGEVYERACRIDNALAGLGSEPGARVAMLTDNCTQVLEQMLGLALGGYVRTSLYTHNSPEVNLHLLDTVQADVLMVQRGHYDAMASVLGDATTLRHVVVFDGDAPGGTYTYEELLAGASPTDREVVIGTEENQVLRFSSGTTGRPKGVVHTVRGWTALGNEMQLIMPALTGTDRYLVASPLSHASAMPLAPVLAAGGAVVVRRAFDPADYLAAIESHRCTLVFGVPTMVAMVARHPRVHTTDLSSLRSVIYGGSPMTETTLNEARAVFGDIMLQLYGQSEAAPVTYLAPEDHLAEGGRWLRSAGSPTPNTRVTIVDERGDPVDVGQVGEVAAHSPTAFAAIWGDSEATRQRLLPDGSVLTRDMGYLDQDGYLFLTDRKEDLIISGGFNIWPAEIENALVAHPAVQEASVVGVPHDKWGETPMALVVLVDGASVTEDELITWTRDRLGPVKRVDRIRFGTGLPKSAIGKVLRSEVRELYASEQPVKDVMS